MSLGNEFRTPLIDRLPAGFFEGLEVDLAAWDGAESRSRRLPGLLKAATANQNAALDAGFALVGSFREMLRIVKTPATVLKAFGVGSKMGRTSVRQVVAGLDAVREGIAKYPEAARAAGILPSDAERARLLRDAIIQADTDQESKKQQRTLSVADRNKVAQRIDAAVRTLSAIGLCAFAHDPAIADRFRALLKRRSAPARDPKPAEPTP